MAIDSFEGAHVPAEWRLSQQRTFIDAVESGDNGLVGVDGSGNAVGEDCPPSLTPELTYLQAQEAVTALAHARIANAYDGERLPFMRAVAYEGDDGEEAEVIRAGLPFYIEQLGKGATDFTRHWSEQDGVPPDQAESAQMLDFSHEAEPPTQATERGEQ